jgi:hypothetical protein
MAWRVIHQEQPWHQRLALTRRGLRPSTKQPKVAAGITVLLVFIRLFASAWCAASTAAAPASGPAHNAMMLLI